MRWRVATASACHIASVEAVRQAYRFGNLQDFLDIYYQGMSVLITEQDFYDLAFAYLERAHADNVRHVEMFFDPQGHTSRGIAFATVIEGLTRAIVDAGRKLGVRASLIMCFLRHLDEADAERTLDSALAFKDRIVGVGLDSSEAGNPPSKFKHVFGRAREAGFFLSAHAGEEGPPSYVWEALDVLGVARIDHGIRSMEDEALVTGWRARKSRSRCAHCPICGCGLSTISRIIRCDGCWTRAWWTVNSDDPAYFGGYVNQNYRACRMRWGSRDEVAAIVRNGIRASLMPRRRRKRYSRRSIASSPRPNEGVQGRTCQRLHSGRVGEKARLLARGAERSYFLESLRLLPSSSGPGRRPLTAKTGVRVP